ncbi:MAG: cold shock domain-containing protein [Candidatus Lambdaproteobacteria bacterium]|nr:cold shock domain-containing protein [Candidatus Lambdaproteobacteria bacterium]
MEGKVTTFDARKGVGTIRAESGEELSVHRSAIEEGGQGSLFPGDVVEFTVGRNRWGHRAALAVRRIGWDEEDDPDGAPGEWTF